MDTATREIFDWANALVSEHNELAQIRAALQAEELREQGDMDGHYQWRRVLHMVKIIQAEAPPLGHHVH